MKNKKFEVRIYYSSFCSYVIDAEDENEAILKARELPRNETEILENIEDWQDADEAIEL